jgi:hypothetical protein
MTVGGQGNGGIRRIGTFSLSVSLANTLTLGVARPPCAKGSQDLFSGSPPHTKKEEWILLKALGEEMIDRSNVFTRDDGRAARTVTAQLASIAREQGEPDRAEDDLYVRGHLSIQELGCVPCLLKHGVQGTFPFLVVKGVDLYVDLVRLQSWSLYLGHD